MANPKRTPAEIAEVIVGAAHMVRVIYPHLSETLHRLVPQVRALASAETPPVEQPQRWEYRILESSINTQLQWESWRGSYLSALNEGWEFVNLTVVSEEVYWFATLRRPAAAAPVPDNSAELDELRRKLEAVRDAQRIFERLAMCQASQDKADTYQECANDLGTCLGLPAEKGGEA